MKCCVCNGIKFLVCVERDEFARAGSISAGVERDLIEPGFEFLRFAQSLKAFVSTNEGLLAQVACIVSVSCIPQDKVVDGTLPAFDQGIKGGDVSCLELCDQLRIVYHERSR